MPVLSFNEYLAARCLWGVIRLAALGYVLHGIYLESGPFVFWFLVMLAVRLCSEDFMRALEKMKDEVNMRT